MKQTVSLLIAIIIAGIFFSSCSKEEKEGVWTPGNEIHFTSFGPNPKAYNWYTYVDSDGDGIAETQVKNIPKTILDSIENDSVPVIFNLLVQDEGQGPFSDYRGHKTREDDKVLDELVAEYYERRKKRNMSKTEGFWKPGTDVPFYTDEASQNGGMSRLYYTYVECHRNGKTFLHKVINVPEQAKDNLLKLNTLVIVDFAPVGKSLDLAMIGTDYIGYRTSQQNERLNNAINAFLTDSISTEKNP